jgi:hypothetical protein
MLMRPEAPIEYRVLNDTPVKELPGPAHLAALFRAC